MAVALRWANWASRSGCRVPSVVLAMSSPHDEQADMAATTAASEAHSTHHQPLPRSWVGAPRSPAAVWSSLRGFGGPGM